MDTENGKFSDSVGRPSGLAPRVAVELMLKLPNRISKRNKNACEAPGNDADVGDGASFFFE